MGRYYIHKVGHQEMGSINTRGEIPARGRYFLISKSCLDFFPHISSVVMNDIPQSEVLGYRIYREASEKRSQALYEQRDRS